jgi:thiol-disulfide isomerase/thioredoxin
MKKNTIIISIVAALLILIPLGYYFYYESAPGPLDTFAQCLKDKGVIFYGAFWCPHCQAQKALFGKSVKLLPYVECSTLDAQGQNQLCNEKQISGYPTWQFPDGTRQSGEMSLQQLSDKSACPLLK